MWKSASPPAISGYINEVWTKVNQIGTYRGVCAELCGRDHGFMPIVVNVVSEDDYKAFIRSEEHTSALQSIMRNSYAVFCLKKKNNTKNNHLLLSNLINTTPLLLS